MNPTTPRTDHRRTTSPTAGLRAAGLRAAGLRAAGLMVAGLLAAGGTLAGCRSTSSSVKAGNTVAGSSANAGAAAAGPVLPVADNPIKNLSTVKALTIDAVLVENNVAVAGKTASDHLEIALGNTGGTDLAGVEVFYSFTDPKTNVTERYYAKLPNDFTVPAGGKRIAHFDDTGAPDHFPVNKYSLYYTDTNALDVSVTVSATGAAVQTATLKKDAGGPETAD